ncbi:MAG: indole-3-glycerol-phosphate synthase [Candidatus Nezhaarchaeota archaeon]|nr:indole-3-glycerol-phosphate synthase [Candidatus Nezhaarchaeota archaeon]
MGDFLRVLVNDAIETVRSGYYEDFVEVNVACKASLKEGIASCKHAAIIAEVKPTSPSRGVLRRVSNPTGLARAIEAGGGVGISVLTEPKHFNGSLRRLAEVKRATRLPVMMKDVIVDPAQVEAAARLGADAVLLVYSIFAEGGLSCSLDELIGLAHSKGLEVLLECHSMDELLSALETEADLIGVNNRDLRTLEVDLNTTKSLLSNVDVEGRIVVSESGIETAADVLFLSMCGAKAFLVGSAVMLAEDVERKVRELVMAL